MPSYPQYSPAVANRLYNQQKALLGSNSSPYALSSKGPPRGYLDSGMAMQWKELSPARRHDALICQFQEMPKEKLVMKGNIVLCLDTTFLIGKR